MDMGLRCPALHANHFVGVLKQTFGFNALMLGIGLIGQGFGVDPDFF